MKTKVAREIWETYPFYYDAIMMKFYPYIKWLDELSHIIEFYINRLPNNTVRLIDLGCGTGNLIRKLIKLKQKYPLSITGVDIAANALDIAKDKAGNNALFYKVDLGQNNQGMVKKDFCKCKKYHMVTMNNVFYSLSPVQKLNMMSEIKKLLHKHGYVIISEPQKPVNTGAIIKKFLSIAGPYKLFQFLAAMVPHLYSLKQVMNINHRFLEKTIHAGFSQQKLFAEKGFKLNALFNNVYLGSNTIEIYKAR